MNTRQRMFDLQEDRIAWTSNPKGGEPYRLASDWAGTFPQKAAQLADLERHHDLIEVHRRNMQMDIDAIKREGRLAEVLRQIKEDAKRILERYEERYEPMAE